MTDGHRERLVEVEHGVRLHLIEAGPEDGPLVILLHGFPEFWYGWRRQIGPLAEAGFRVMVPDQRGYNLSDKPAGIGAYAVDRLADDVLRLADEAGRSRFSVVGHDWGGIVAWWLALRNPDRVERAAILNAPHPVALRRYMASHASQMGRSWYVLFFQLPALPEALIGANGYRFAERALTGSSRRGTFTPDDLARYREAWARPGAMTAMVNWYRALRRRSRPPAERVRIPVLILWGDRDAFLEKPLADLGAALCDDARLVHFERATHWIQHEEAEAVNAQLLAFLSPAQSPKG